MINLGIADSFVEELKKEYLDREVDVKSSKESYKDSRGVEHSYEHHSSDDPLISEVVDKLQTFGFVYRIFYPGMAGTMDYRTDRINVYINQDDKNKFKITSIEVG